MKTNVRPARKAGNPWIIFSMEIRRLLGNRKLLMTTFLLAPVMVFFMLYIMNMEENQVNAGRLALYGAEAYRQELEEIFEEVPMAFREGEPVLTQEEPVALVLTDAGVQVLRDGAFSVSGGLQQEALEIADSLAALDISREGFPAYRAAAAVTVLDISTDDQRLSGELMMILSMVFLIGLMMTNMAVGSLAAEILAGERERGSFDLLRLSGAGTGAILLGKYAFLVLTGVLLLILDALFVILGLARFQPELYRLASRAAAGRLWFLPVLGCFGSAALTSGGAFLVIGASFRKASQAMAYVGAAQLVLSLMSFVPRVLGEGWLGYLPISNLSPVTELALRGEPTLYYVAGSLGLSLVFAACALVLSAAILEWEVKE